MRRLIMTGVFGAAALTSGCAPPAATQAPGAAGWELPTLPPPIPITREEYQSRRAALAAGMEDGVFVAFGAAQPPQDYLPFAQSVAIRYLTGIAEPDVVLMMSRSGGQVAEQLFVLPRDPAREVWEGVRLGAEGAEARTGIPARSRAALAAVLDSVAASAPRLYTLAPLAEPRGTLDVLSADQQIVARLRARNPQLEVISLAPTLERLRAEKSAAEIDRIRRAVYITNLAHRAALGAVEPGRNEFEVQALIEYVFRRNGAERPSFATIVGSGPNSTTLHYNANDRFMQAGETVVMDVGASYDGYAADVTRTLPVSGRFSAEQRAVYEIVLAAQKAAESLVRPGSTWQELNQAASRTIAEGLARLGLIESPTATYQCGPGNGCPQYRLYYMHGLGHGIGLEVHDPDVSTYGAFRPGAVFTIEPGIYVRADALDHLPDTPANRAMIDRLRPALERYRNVGVRIEDDYLVTGSGAERLSAGAPREIAEIEAVMALPPDPPIERRGEVVEWYLPLAPR